MAIHPEQLRLDRAGELPRGQRRIYDILFPWLTRKVRQGLPAYLIPSREWLAQQARVSLSTVTRAFANMHRLGLLDIQERYRKGKGNLRRQLTNLIRLPFRRPEGQAPEVVKVAHQTRRLKKKTLNKVASGLFSKPRHAPARRGGGFVSTQTILERWEKRGFPVGVLEKPPMRS